MSGQTRRRGSFAIGAAGVVGIAAVAHVLPGAVAWRQARCRVLPRLSGVGDRRHLALTFDDGPDEASTPHILDLLDDLHWKATFFCLGSQVEKAPDLTIEIARRGHEIGAHGFQHTSHLRRPAPWTIRDLSRSRDLITSITGQEPTWFRPPYGALSASSLTAARVCGLQTVLWTTWGRDWREDATGDTVARDVTRTMYPGATVLLHDSDITSARGSWKATLSALPVLAERWNALGLSVGPLGEHGIARNPRAG